MLSIMIEVDVVCPIYHEFDSLKKLYESYFTQENVKINRVVFPYTLSDDEKENEEFHNFFKEKGIHYFDVKKEEFSHSLTREKAIREYCVSNIIIMMSQDIVLTNSMVFYNLVRSIDSHESVYNYARQVCKYKRSIEKYIRERNYPKESFYVSKEDIDRMQIMAFFSSDACSAYNREVFIKLGGYQGYNIMMNEDQLYSKVILEAGYKKKYCGDAIVEHSHKYTFKQLYKRYYEAGIFYSTTKLFEGYKNTEAGKNLAFYILKQALKHFNIPVLLRWLPDMTSRYLGMKKGKKEGLKR